MKKTICLIDGSGYIFRAFYALPLMTDPKGIPVNAVYGFTNMFLKLTNSIKCDYSLVLFDAKRQNFRNEIFPDYKGTRGETPEELIPQFPLIRDAVEALNLNQLEMEGYEADDLIATYARQAKEAGVRVVVVSADKDLMQLISDGVELYDPMKDKFFTPEDVKEKFGVYPDKVVDVQALAGDSIDNVPGIPGIGIKTAAELINQFGSLDAVLERAEEIKQNKRREMVIEHKNDALVSLELVTLKTDVPVEFDFSHYECRRPDKQKIMDFVDLHAFKTIRPRVEKWLEEQCGNEESSVQIKEIEPQYEKIKTEKEISDLVQKIRQKRAFSFYVDAIGENPLTAKIEALAIGIGEGKAYVISCQESVAEPQDLFSMVEKEAGKFTFSSIAKFFEPLFASRSILKIGAEIKRDIHLIRRIIGKQNEIFPIDDVAVMSYVLDGSAHNHDIKNMAEIFLGKEINEDDLAQKADFIFRLYDILKPRLRKEKQLAVYENIDRPLISILQKMEEEGIKVDSTALLRLKSEFELEMKKYEDEIYALAGEKFNIASPKQIGEILFGKMGIKPKKTAKGSYKTDAETLEMLAEEYELPAKILDWRSFAKLKSTYTDSILNVLDKNSRVHTTFNQIVVNTGRLASSNPNLQNIPVRTKEGRKIREVFVAKEGCKIVSADYSQVELRLLAEVADVKMLKEAFAKGVDVHAETAAKVFGLSYENVDSEHRRQAKAINFGIVYGISAYGLAKQIGSTPDVAKRYIDNYFEVMPEIKNYMEKTKKFAHENGYVMTPFGRKCVIFGINDGNQRTVAFAERAAINAPIQGGAADIIKLAMQKVAHNIRDEKFQSKILLQIHDELVLEVPDDELEKVKVLLKETMENVIKSSVDFVIDIGVGKNWGEAH